jgi:hypothetical protein
MQGQGNVAGGGSNSGTHAKMFQPGDLAVFKVVASESLEWEFNFLWYELPEEILN